MVEVEFPPLEFSEFVLDFDKNRVLSQHQFHYMKQLETIHMSDESAYLMFRYAHMKLPWLSNTRIIVNMKCHSCSRSLKSHSNKVLWSG